MRILTLDIYESKFLFKSIMPLQQSQIIRLNELANLNFINFFVEDTKWRITSKRNAYD